MTTTPEEIVARVRDEVEWAIARGSYNLLVPTSNLTALLSILSEQTGEVERWKQSLGEWKALALKQEDRAQAAETALSASREREKVLEAALECIRDQPDTHPTIGGRWIDWAKGRARAALTPKPLGGEA